MGGRFHNWSDKNIIKFLEKNNFKKINTVGDDHIFFNGLLNASVKVTSPRKSTPTGTMLNIVRNSKISKRKWLNFRNNKFN